MKAKCYQGNYDGLRKGFVVANSQKAAAEVVGCSLYDFRNFWTQTNWPDSRKFNPKPLTLYTRKYDFKSEWVEGRCELNSICPKGHPPG